MAIKVDKFKEECEQILDEYKAATFDNVKKAVDLTAKEAVKVTKARSPVRTGAYAKSWKSKITDNHSVYYGRTVHNDKHYRLTHLLEHGHNIDGYMKFRTRKTRTKAFPHIMTDDEVEKAFTKNLEKELDKE